MLPIPQIAIDFLRGEEGCVLYPYKDIAGYWTIGIGHLIKPGENFSAITNQEASDLLCWDLQIAAASIHRLVKRELGNNQYAALLSFAFNLGGGTLQRSTLLKKCNRLEDDDVPAEFMKYVYASGKKVTGLIKRRAGEAKLYMA